jgi:hypothetical protein
MSKFSSRHGYDPRDQGPPKVEDAPDWMRVSYINGILDKLTFVDGDSRYMNADNRPLGIKALGEAFFVLLRQEPDQDLYDSFSCWDTLKSVAKSVEWFHFYDLVELVGKKLREAEEWQFDQTWSRRFGVAKYQKDVNEVFAENRIAWRLNSNCELGREVPSVLEKAHAGADSALKDEFEPAREHYRKAFRYVFERPIDPQNSIKEVVSAIESVGKVFYEKSSTLGDVIKKMKSDPKLPTSVVDVLEKFYVMSNAEPGVRHGSNKRSNVSIQDAELCLHIGVAFIRYLLAKHGKST